MIQKVEQMNDPLPSSDTLFAPLTVDRRPTFSLQDLVAEFHEHQSDWSIPEAFLCLVLSAAFADGRLAEQEAEELRALSHRSRILKNLTANELASLNSVVIKRRADRPDYIQEACQTLPRDMHLSVFAHCLDICLADGTLVASEAGYLEKLLDHLAVTAEDAALTTRILSVKNRY